MPKWLSDAVFYEIYPQSFCDSNNDGIGDIGGIISKLDYIKELGCNAIWLNPIYDSPFMDAGYDVRDHKKVAQRYGTMEDAQKLIDEVHRRDMKILFDLVPGHTSDTNEWFLKSKKAEKNEFTDRYIFTNSVWEAPPQYRLMCGICERDGNYLVNYFSSQPALNYGFAEITHPSWQKSVDDPSCKKTVDALKDIMRFWLDKGVDGFRVDMADSLVKNDETKKPTAQIWRDIRKMLDTDYPNAAMVAEWCAPVRAINDGGFHMDFYLDHYGNGYSRLFRYIKDGENKSFFSENSKGDITAFLDEYLENFENTKDNGYISFMTNNHDMPRAPHYMSDDEIKLSHAFIFTMPGVPFLYYGDEIGMRYNEKLVSKEGGFSRTGSRTPMQWNSGKNLGFSNAEQSALYLSVDSSPNAPTVELQKGDKNSIYENLKTVIALRKKYAELSNDGDFEVVYAEKERYPFVYRRGKFTLFVNPSVSEVTVPLDFQVKDEIFVLGSYSIADKKIKLGEKSFVILES